MKAAALALMLCWLPPLLGCQPLALFDLPYRVSYGGAPLGAGRMSMSSPDGGSCFVYRLVAQPFSALRWLLGDLEQASRFCVRDGRIMPSSFHHRQGGDQDQSYQLEFDWAAGRVRGGGFGSSPLPEGALDPLSIQLHVRRWLCHALSENGEPASAPIQATLVDRRGIRRYALKVTAEQSVEVPAGVFRTYRVARADQDRTDTRFWLARDHDLLIVRARQQRGDRPAVDIQLQALAPAEKEVSPVQTPPANSR